MCATCPTTQRARCNPTNYHPNPPNAKTAIHPKAPLYEPYKGMLETSLDHRFGKAMTALQRIRHTANSSECQILSRWRAIGKHGETLPRFHCATSEGGAAVAFCWLARNIANKHRLTSLFQACFVVVWRFANYISGRSACLTARYACHLYRFNKPRARRK